MIKNTVFKAFAGWFAAGAARTLRPAYLPTSCAPEGQQQGAHLEVAYHKAVVEGYQAMTDLMAKQQSQKAANTLHKHDITANVQSVGEQFQKAATTLDPDGIASEIIRLFCVGVPHMDKLNNQRRVATVWSALLAPAVVMREKRGYSIVLDDLVRIAVQWLQTGSTDLAEEAYGSPDTRFISAHPARIYELLTDTAKQHDIEHKQLLASVIEPVVLPIGQYVGSRQAAAGVQVDLTAGSAAQEETV